MERNRSLRQVLFLVILTVLFTSQSTGEPVFVGSVPEAVRRPEQLINPVYPVDLSIGSLGPGEVSLEVYSYTRRVLGEILQGKADSVHLSSLSSKEKSELFEKITEVEPRKYRAGGGREENDGSISFLFRFIGREKELAGQIFLNTGEEGAIKLDGIIPEEPQDLNAIKKNDLPYPWTPYNRFF